MNELDRIHTQLLKLTEDVGDTQVIAARTEERIADFILRSEDRQRKQSERLEAIEAAQSADRKLQQAVQAETARKVDAIRIWAAAAGLLVPTTLAVVAWVLSRIPPSAWSAIGGSP